MRLDRKRVDSGRLQGTATGFRTELPCHAIVDEPVPGDARESAEALGDDPNAKVSPFAGARMACVARALILHVEPDGRELPLERSSDAIGRGAGLGRRARGLRRAHLSRHSCTICLSAPTPALSGVARRASQSAWAKMNTAVARVSPNTLKFTHVRSLA